MYVFSHILVYLARLIKQCERNILHIHINNYKFGYTIYAYVHLSERKNNNSANCMPDVFAFAIRPAKLIFSKTLSTGIL